MAVQLAREVKNTGFTADHWVADEATIDSARNVFSVYKLYKSAADEAAGKRHVDQIAFQLPTVAPATDTIAIIAGKLDTAIIAVGAPLDGGVVV